MKHIHAEALCRFVVEHYEERLAERDLTLREETDLLESGVIDSLGILELIRAMESRFGVRIDLEGLPPEQLTLVGPLCAYVAANARPALPTGDARDESNGSR